MLLDQKNDTKYVLLIKKVYTVWLLVVQVLSLYDSAKVLIEQREEVLYH